MKVASVTIIFLVASFLYSHDILAKYIVNNNEVTLDKMDIPETSLISEILKDVLTECGTNDNGRLFSLLITDQEPGEKVYIALESDRRIELFENLLGYALIGNDTIIVYGKNLPEFQYSKNPMPMCFPIKDYMRDDTSGWLYFIYNGIIARDGESMGWLWHIPSDRLREYKLSKFAVTAPRRTTR